ncbi:hypothetical protein ASPNIDRAFT_37415 [Aspergillus niger ATCC 1015]|uniref:Uncharacterized protein n=1 Tax=Aspergillus niger (strain ATCC 1015 / CBS 113.46 / FGSC A1144 / LSHB Ac4 / NCTC 3858a / NRRL 328 / USDA 3528.7) TaxID=380704 RepID=G3Y1V2_ASPNA|nr:hypothetical protein ASPNIDRAFT_37415 [Aspergillus niger ATCC 1015]
MRKQGYGRIIHIASYTFEEPELGLGVYDASKAAIIGLVHAASVEAGLGVTVNAVMPELIRMDQKQNTKRCGLPEDIAHTSGFVASPEAAFTTGPIFDVSGGETFYQTQYNEIVFHNGRPQETNNKGLLRHAIAYSRSSTSVGPLAVTCGALVMGPKELS